MMLEDAQQSQPATKNFLGRQRAAASFRLPFWVGAGGRERVTPFPAHEPPCEGGSLVWFQRLQAARALFLSVPLPNALWLQAV